MNCRPTLLAFILVFLSTSIRSQETVCEGSPCTSNDFTIDYFYLGDAEGNPFDQGSCEPGTLVDSHLWINFTANAAASRYSLYLHFNLYVNGVFIGTIDECYFNGQPIPTSVTLDAYSFNWECGAEVSIQDLYMSWQTNANGNCGCASSHCYSDPLVVVFSPLIADFVFNTNCLTEFTVDFTSTTSGGTQPYTYFWEFGDGNTSTEENPTHTYDSDGPFTVSIMVQDAENTDYQSYEVLDFDTSISPEINAPPDMNIEGCDLSSIPLTIYSESPIEISESDFNDMGGNLLLGNDLVSLTYQDNNSGVCPINIIRTFTLIDACDNIVSTEQNITISDSEMPTASNPIPIILNCNSDIPTPNIDVVTDEADNCSNPTVAFVSDVSDNMSCPETITRTYSITDECGNSIEVNQLIIIEDDILPTASNPANINISCVNDIPSPDISVVTDEADNCSNPTVAFVSDISDNLSCPETITRTYSVTDDCGNSIEVNQLIIIEDNILPTASNPADINISCVDEIPSPDINVVTDEVDNCSIATVAFVSDVSDNQSCLETITRTYSVTDECGNSIFVTQSIYIIDNNPPELASEYESQIYITCEEIPEVPLLEFTDNCTTSIDVTFDEVFNQTDNLNFDIQRTWVATDPCGNQSTYNQSIYVNNTNESTAKYVQLCIDDDPLNLNSMVTYQETANTNALINEWDSDTIELLQNGIFDPSSVQLGDYEFINMSGNDCIRYTTIYINVHDDCENNSCIESTDDITISKMVTPNNDGFNDFFDVDFIINEESSENCDISVNVQIYNRWGTKIFESNKYNNDWAGIANSSSASDSGFLPTGTYYYIVDLVNSGLKSVQGYIYLGTE